MGVKITITCDICHEEDTTYTWGEDPKAHGWEVNRNYCLCPECNNKQFDDHARGQEEKSAHIEAVQRQAA